MKNLIYGKHAVTEFITNHPNMVKEVWTSHYKEFINEVNPDLKPIVKSSTNDKMERLFDQKVNHQGYVAEVKEFNYTPLNEMIENLTKEDKATVLILDQIHDPYNFGAILRSATQLNFKNIIILDRKQVMVNSTVVKTSAGTAYDLNIAKVPNLSIAVDKLKDAGFWVYASNLNKDAQDMRKVDFDKKTALIIGNEEKGISDKLTKNADVNIYIPSSNKIDSYNASVASALMMYEIANKLELI
ncbi:23S rRNA (guanosine(2251)-2'-O)-methyltransferase RlmB [Mesoplasma lactucae]|uniref:23S rRNA (Guanosine(2251)-2'-O)-methyltransferase RlmB n=1 Tax=Mesoplasma lactucae ATCC 49193 TaxID=81460 RepID=A0A291ISA3_9MOLU|nr:23S rRNA (guanosine(2251)-2'-O)-methyltransferase RlmB [Mesoplasma lactucae]ATG97669.1 23S rRNA (guanosine(2251)-2'-O)-methyltransferase RlmB [Mesoplasma lactucae ATCC 49193]ATZ19866.1 23S rRNA (guanosine2251-2'-O)-methyltransferase [Mesoplasma lactucae ATCC 49193]MCL8216729.1 putative TrmH family tRNA/rRNA methyltransferase [Mesoplasma lactucae ATCC 49193]